VTDTTWCQQPCHPLDAAAEAAARARQAQLTKPAGSLGLLETLAIRLAAQQGREKPQIDTIWFALFAGDHGVVAEGVAAYPQAVTVQMLANFVAGGAAISVLAREMGAHLEVHNLGTVADASALAGVVQHELGPGTANFTQGPAMTEAQCAAALNAGRQVALRAKAGGCQLLLGGEMGIGNTTAASALACALLEVPLGALVGPGTGLDHEGMLRKQRVIQRALSLHAGQREALDWLQRLGGLEIAALVGAYLGCAQQGITVLVDGMICSVAALIAVRMNPQVAGWLLFGHCGAEPGHHHVLAALEAEPLLRLGLRLGEGSGAALAVPLVKLACALHGQMATFAEAAVQGQLP
jgi:nicotinate-nucleotide--dimethylbenzimidazole phosphoribosyltransferase